MIMQIAARQAWWAAKTACSCPPYQAQQHHGTHPVPTTGTEDRVTSVTRRVDTGNKPPFPPVSLQMSLCVTNVCVLAAQAAAAHLPGQFPASHILACDDLRLCNHLMGSCAAVSFPKVSSNISAGSFKFYAEISKWPTKMTSFIFRKYSVHILVFEQFWGAHFALRAWLSHKLSATKCHSVLLVNYGFWKRCIA